MAKIIIGSLNGMSEGAQISGYMGISQVVLSMLEYAYAPDSIKILSTTKNLTFADMDSYNPDNDDETQEIIKKISKRLKLSESMSKLKRKK